jgi:hypothetical protein
MPGIAYSLGMNSGPAVAGVKAFQGALGGMQGAIGKITGALGLLGIGFAAFKSADVFTDQLKNIFEAGKELNTTRAITGQTITDLVTLRKAFGEAGLAPEGLSGSLIKLQKALGGVNDEGQPTGHIFQQLGLSIAQLKGESATQQLTQIGAAINHLGNQADKTFATMQIFGREGAEMLALFADTHAITDAERSMAAYGAVMTRNAGIFKALTNTLAALHNKVKGFFVGFADAIGPVLLPLLEKLKNSINLVGFGEKIGAAVSKAAQLIYGLFQNGTLSETVGAALKVGFSSANEFLSKSLNEMLEAASKVAPNLMAGLGNFFTALKNIFLGLADMISGSIAKGVAASLRGLTSTKLGQILGINDTSVNDINSAGNDLQDEGGERAQKGMKQIADGSAIGAAVTSQLTKLASGFALSAADALKVVEKNVADARTTGAQLPIKARGETPKKDTGSMGLGNQKPKIEPLGDRLSKIGGFIGGKGGVKGQRAAEDTARHTGTLVELQRKTNELLANTARSGGARF